MNTHDSILSIIKKGTQTFAVSYYLTSSCIAKVHAHMPYLITLSLPWAGIDSLENMTKS